MFSVDAEKSSSSSRGSCWVKFGRSKAVSSLTNQSNHSNRQYKPWYASLMPWPDWLMKPSCCYSFYTSSASTSDCEGLRADLVDPGNTRLRYDWIKNSNSKTTKRNATNTSLDSSFWGKLRVSTKGHSNQNKQGFYTRTRCTGLMTSDIKCLERFLLFFAAEGSVQGPGFVQYHNRK